MTEAPPEPRTVFPVVMFNRPRLWPTAGEKEGIITTEAMIAIRPPQNTIDFRPKSLPADVEVPEQQAPAGDAEDPKVADSSATGSASESGDDSSESTTTPTQMPTQTTSPTSSSESTEETVTAEKEVPATTGGLPVRTIGVSAPPAETTGEPPAA